MIGKLAFMVIYAAARFVMFLAHPVFRVYGRENIPSDGALLICPNHSGLADPIWAIFAIRPKKMPRAMAKKELMDTPVLGRVLRWFGVFGVDRAGADVKAIKTSLKCLKSGQRLLLFPEGTRVKNGKKVTPKGGAILLAHRTGTPILPMYISPRTHIFSPVFCVIGSPVTYDFGEEKPGEEQLLSAAADLMKKTYDLRDIAWK